MYSLLLFIIETNNVNKIQIWKWTLHAALFSQNSTVWNNLNSIPRLYDKYIVGMVLNRVQYGTNLPEIRFLGYDKY